MFMLMLDMTITIAAMASIKTELNASLSDLQWVIDAYTLPVAGLLLTAATLGDRLGRRRLYLIGMAVFTLASAGCAMAGDALTLTIVRAVQGVGAVLLFGVGLPLIANAYPDLKKRAGAIGVFGAVLAAATAIGPLVGGALVDGPGVALDLSDQRPGRRCGTARRLATAAGVAVADRPEGRLARHRPAVRRTGRRSARADRGQRPRMDLGHRAGPGRRDRAAAARRS